MVDPVQALEMAKAQLKQLEQFCPPEVWRDLELATQTMAASRQLSGAAARTAGMAQTVATQAQARPQGQPGVACHPGGAVQPALAVQPQVPVPVDLFVTDTKVVISAALPGIERPGDIQVAMLGDSRIRLSGVLPAHPLSEQGRAAAQERPSGPFTRTVGLPAPVRADTARSIYRNGVLEIWLDRAGEQERTVPILF